MYDEAAEHDDAANAETADNRFDNDNSDDHVLLAPLIAAGPCPSKARGARGSIRKASCSSLAPKHNKQLVQVGRVLSDNHKVA